MKKLFTLLLFLTIAGLGLKAQTTIVIKGNIDLAGYNLPVWVNYYGTPSTCTIQDTTTTDTLGNFTKTIVIGSGCSYGDIIVNMIGCKSAYDTLVRVLHYDSTTTNPDTMTVNFGYCDTCNVLPGFTSSVSGFNASFTNTTPVFNPMYYTWYFGDGTSVSNGGNATHTYAWPGTYNVCLVALDAIKKCSYTYCSKVTIGAGCGSFAGGFSSSVLSTTATFTNTSSSGANEFTWYFGDGSTSTSANPTHNYGKAGTYNVCLKVRDTVNGCADSVCNSLTVVDCSIFDANFTAPITLSLSQNFINTSSSTANKFFWMFGDGNTSTAANPTHTYTSAGTYTVCLFAEDTVNGCSDSLCKNITVVDCGALIPGFTYTTAPDSVFLTNTTNTLSGTTNYYVWSFGDGNISTATNPTHVYTNPGTYTICLEVGSTAGCKDSFCTTVTIVSQCNTYSANFSHTAGGLNVAFANTSSSGTNYNYWTFGDGNASTAANPTHTYTSAGTYTVCLVAQNTAKGCIDSVCQTITVTNPCAGFAAGFTSTVSCQTIAFTNSSSSSANQLLWVFSDGSYSTATNPTHTFATIGTFDACLIAMDSVNGCQDSVCQSFTINPGIGGTIYRDSSMNIADSGLVYLIEVTIDTVANDTILTAIDSAYFSYATGGSYQFSPVPTGYYLVKAALLSGSAFYANRIPTYYVQETRWNNATPVLVNAACINADIELINGTNPGGSGFIGGYVSVGANKTGDPVEHVEVLLYNADNTPFGYTYTDANGEYKFDNIAYGTYKVVVEVVGKPCEEYLVTIDNANPGNSGGNFEVNTTDITLKKSGNTGIAGINRQNLAIYPNPATSVVNVSFAAATQGTATITLTDLAGKQILTAQQPVETGSNTITMDIARINYGVYILTVTSGNSVYMGKLSVNR